MATPLLLCALATAQLDIAPSDVLTLCSSSVRPPVSYLCQIDSLHLSDGPDARWLANISADTSPQRLAELVDLALEGTKNPPDSRTVYVCQVAGGWAHQYFNSHAELDHIILHQDDYVVDYAPIQRAAVLYNRPGVFGGFDFGTLLYPLDHRLFTVPRPTAVDVGPWVLIGLVDGSVRYRRAFKHGAIVTAIADSRLRLIMGTVQSGASISCVTLSYDGCPDRFGRYMPTRAHKVTTRPSMVGVSITRIAFDYHAVPRQEPLEGIRVMPELSGYSIHEGKSIYFSRDSWPSRLRTVFSPSKDWDRPLWKM